MTSGSRAPTTTRCACHDTQMNSAAYILHACKLPIPWLHSPLKKEVNSLELLKGAYHNHVSAPSCAFRTLVYALLYK